MGETAELVWRGVAYGAFDLAAAWVCGSLLATWWIRTHRAEVKAPRMSVAATVMVLALATQFYVLLESMAGSTKWSVMRASLHDVATMNAGAALLWSLGAAAVLMLLSFARDRFVMELMELIALLTVFAVHSAVGHAGGTGNFSKLEFLQFFHVSAMAVWAGAVMVSGLVVKPRIVGSGAVNVGYLRSLSRAAMISVAVVLLTGAMKGWIGLGGQLNGLWTGAWGIVLSVKIVLVCVALVLGFVHMRWIRARETWTPEQTKAVLSTLRVEAVCLVMVILLSGFLGNLDPA